MTKNEDSKRKNHVHIHIHKGAEEVKEIFIGLKTFLSLMGFSVGTILVGRSLWEYGQINIGVHYTLLAGILIFLISAIALKKIHF